LFSPDVARAVCQTAPGDDSAEKGLAISLAVASVAREPICGTSDAPN